jgi:hypothetical protein
MDCKCECCGDLIDLLGREPFLPEPSRYRCDSCERIEADTDKTTWGLHRLEARVRRAA